MAATKNSGIPEHAQDRIYFGHCFQLEDQAPHLLCVHTKSQVLSWCFHQI